MCAAWLVDSDPSNVFADLRRPGATTEEKESRDNSSEARQCPATLIALLHGAWHGVWTWDNGFVDRLVDGGFEVLALSLRGHGNSGGSARFASLGKYLSDLSSVVEDLDRSPVVVGHSMGGLITQRLIAKQPVAGAVLMVSASPEVRGR